jgi:hypothetical protein
MIHLHTASYITLVVGNAPTVASAAVAPIVMMGAETRAPTRVVSSNTCPKVAVVAITAKTDSGVAITNPAV